jgi:hypothetical protein
MAKKIFGFLIALLAVCQFSYAAIDEVYDDGVRSGRVRAIDFGSGLVVVSASGPVAIVSARLPYYSTSAARPASGASVGSMISKGGVNATDCGATAGGPFFVVCVSDGTNWKAL